MLLADRGYNADWITAEENRAQPIVMGLTGREGEMDREAVAVYDRAGT
jgi:hypothetical protein